MYNTNNFLGKLTYWNYPSTLFVLFDMSSVSSWTFAISSICEVGRRPWLLPLKLLLLDVFVFDSPIYKRGVSSEFVAGLSQLEGTTLLTGFVDELNMVQFREVDVIGEGAGLRINAACSAVSWLFRAFILWSVGEILVSFLLFVGIWADTIFSEVLLGVLRSSLTWRWCWSSKYWKVLILSITQEAETLASASWSQHSSIVLQRALMPECCLQEGCMTGLTFLLTTRSFIQIRKDVA